MSYSKMETVLQALFEALQAEAHPGVRVERNVTIPARIPEPGMIILRDGNPGEPDVLLGMEYYYEHEAEVDIIVDLPPEYRDGRFDLLKQMVGTALAADRTLGGLCDYVDGDAPSPVLIQTEGAEGFKAATISVTLRYGSPDPLL